MLFQTKAFDMPGRFLRTKHFTSPIEIKLKLTKEMFTYRYVEFSTFC